MGHNKLITEGVVLRFVRKEDAQFIVNIRTDRRLGQNLSPTSSNLGDQIFWIEEYKKRETDQKEFYFIIEDSNSTPWGTIRLYNFYNYRFTIGSWICLPDNKEKIAIKAWILAVEYGFEELNFEIVMFDIRKKNKSVLYYAYLYQPTLINEDEFNLYYELDKKTFFKNREKVFHLLNLKMQ